MRPEYGVIYVAQEYPRWQQVTLTTLGELYNEVRGEGVGGRGGGGGREWEGGVGEGGGNRSEGWVRGEGVGVRGG